MFSLKLLLKNCLIELYLVRSSGFIGLRRNFVNLYALGEECASLPISYEAPLKPNELKSYNYTPLFSYWLTTDIVLMCGRE